MPEEKLPETTSFDPNVSAVLSYLLLIVGGVIFYATSKNSYVKFHAMQSILLWVGVAVVYIGITILSYIMPFIWMFDWILRLGLFALWIYLMIKAYQGIKIKLPIIGEMAARYVK